MPRDGHSSCRIHCQIGLKLHQWVNSVFLFSMSETWHATQNPPSPLFSGGKACFLKGLRLGFGIWDLGLDLKDRDSRLGTQDSDSGLGTWTTAPGGKGGSIRGGSGEEEQKDVVAADGTGGRQRGRRKRKLGRISGIAPTGVIQGSLNKGPPPTGPETS